MHMCFNDHWQVITAHYEVHCKFAANKLEHVINLLYDQAHSSFCFLSPHADRHAGDISFTVSVFLCLSTDVL